MEEIKNLVQPLIDRTEFTLEEVQSDCRKPRLTIVRHLLFWYLRSLKNTEGKHLYSLPKIAEFFNRNHSTVIHGINNVVNFIEAKDALTMIYVHKCGLKVHNIIAK